MTITRRIVAPLILLIVISNVIVVAYSLRAVNIQIERSESYRLSDELNALANRLLVSMEELQRDLRVYAELPAIAELALPDGSEDPASLVDAQQTLLAIASGKPQYAQLRLLDSRGLERIRVRRANPLASPAVVPEHDLQDASVAAYFAAAVARDAGDVHLSPISLSREQGRVIMPPRPVIRAATPLRDPQGALRAILVLTQDLGGVFTELQQLAGQRGIVRMTNAEGEYLFHEQPDRTFGFELGFRSSLRDDFPAASGILSLEDGAASLIRTGPRTLPIAVRSVAYAPGESHHRVILLASGESARLRDIPLNLLIQVSIALLGSLLLSSLVAWLIARHITRPIVQMHVAVRSKGQHVTSDDLPLTAEGEVGALAHTFDRLLQDLRRNQSALAAEALRADHARKQVEEGYSRLQQLNQEVEQFAYIASHDLKEPLRTIHSFATMLIEDYGQSMDVDGQEMLRFLQDATQRMEKLINSLLSYTRLGKHSAFASVDLGALINDVRADIGARIRESQANIDVDPMPTIQGMPTELRLLFQNLLANALKFRSPDRTPEIRIHAKALDGGWQFSVCDNGIGIAQSDQARIFMIFERIESDVEGSGIGLAHCKKIVEMHGGSIWVESTKGTGSCFHFTLLEPLFR